MIYDSVIIGGRFFQIRDYPYAQSNPEIFIKSITGLGPPEIDLFMADTAFATRYYQGRRPQTREIVVRLGFNPSLLIPGGYSSLREALYDLWLSPDADLVQFQFMRSFSPVAVTSGYVKTFEANIFSKDPEVQVTFICPEPYIRGLGSDVNLAELNAQSRSSPSVNNIGSAPTGLRFEIAFTAAASSWSISRGNQKMLFNYAFLSGDRLIVDTRPGQRAISLVRAGVTTNILVSLHSSSKWIELIGKYNLFTITPTSYNWVSLYFDPCYWGL